jgi:hypothetical protein
MPLQARVPTHAQPRPSAADESSDLTGGYSYYGYGGHDLSGEGGSCPAGAPRSDDEDDGG